MSIVRQPVLMACDWPGCERAFRSEAHAPAAARDQARAKDWHRMAGLDICPIHPRHEGHFYQGDHQLPDSLIYVDHLRLRCSTCGWTDEDPAEPTKEDSQARWIAHLPELVGEFYRRPGEPTDVERGAVSAAGGS